MAATLPLACLATAKTPQFNLFSPLSSSSLSSSPSLSVSLLSLHSKKWGVLSKRFCGKSKWRAAVAEETLVPEDSPAESPVAVPVLPSDMLTMFFKKKKPLCNCWSMH
ncbi:hypothetical protein AMTR_s00039p00224840 [Amborella trichopoda]|uniref:Uncharacterized protein n=1 Tax=Amborella trichopoda TaxID=13333 RepID=U5D6D2_AMBTC|nr:hypothetical protein AMTR_s00039p00224840 [Amborella trichopoda]